MPYPANIKNYETFSDDHQERRNLFRQLQNKHYYTIRTDFTVTVLDFNALSTPAWCAKCKCTVRFAVRFDDL